MLWEGKGRIPTIGGRNSKVIDTVPGGGGPPRWSSQVGKQPEGISLWILSSREDLQTSNKRSRQRPGLAQQNSSQSPHSQSPEPPNPNPNPNPNLNPSPSLNPNPNPNPNSSLNPNLNPNVSQTGSCFHGSNVPRRRIASNHKYIRLMAYLW